MKEWAVIIALSCAGCAHPTTEEAASFGKVANDAVAAFTENRAVELDLQRAAHIESRACRYLVTGGVNLSPPLDDHGSKLFDSQVNLLTSIADYADALSKATDPKSFADLEAAATQLSTATTGLIAALPNATTSPVTGPVIQLISTVAIDLVELELRARLRAVVEAMQPKLDEAMLLLVNDWDNVESILRARHRAWIEAKSCNLRILHRAAGTPTPALYTTYKDADTEARQFKARISALTKEQLIDLFAKLIEAHKALSSPGIDFPAALAKLKDVATQIRAVQTAVAAKQG